MEIDRGHPNSKTKRERTSNFDAASYWGYIGIMENKMKTTILRLWFTVYDSHMSHSPNFFKGGYIANCIGEYYRSYKGGYYCRSLKP